MTEKRLLWIEEADSSSYSTQPSTAARRLSTEPCLFGDASVFPTKTLPGRQMNAPLLLAVFCQRYFFTIQIDLALPRIFLNGVRVRGSAINGWPRLPLDFKPAYVEQIVEKQFLTAAGAA